MRRSSRPLNSHSYEKHIISSFKGVDKWVSKRKKMTIKKTQLIKLRQLNSAIICLSYFLIWVLLKQGHTVGEVIGNCFLYQTELYLITLLPHSSDSGSYPRNDLFRYFSLCTVWWPLSAQIDWHIITLIITKHLPFQNQKIKYCFLVCQICKMKYYYKYTWS